MKKKKGIYEKSIEKDGRGKGFVENKKGKK